MITICGCWIGCAPHGHTRGATLINNCHHRTAGGHTEVNWMLTSWCNLCKGISGATIAGHSSVKTYWAFLPTNHRWNILYQKTRMLRTKMKYPSSSPPPLNVVSLQWLKSRRCSNTQIEKLNFTYLITNIENEGSNRTPKTPTTILAHRFNSHGYRPDWQRQKKIWTESRGTRNREWLCWRGPTAIFPIDRRPCHSSDFGFS
jgi:hypothetical protein